MPENISTRLSKIARDLDRRGMYSEADEVTKVLANLRLSQTAWQNFGDAVQNVGQGAFNAAQSVNNFAYDWLTPVGLAQQSIAFLQNQFNTAVDTQVKEKVANELVRRGVQPGGHSSSQQTMQPNQFNGPTSGPQNAGSTQGADEQNHATLAQNYVHWADGLKSQGFNYDQTLNALYQHVSQNQSPEFANNFLNWYKTNYPRPSGPIQGPVQPMQGAQHNPQSGMVGPLSYASSKTGKFKKLA